ncbi:MAG: XrtA system polysaccharide deacetylase [Fibrobacterota bacterium]
MAVVNALSVDLEDWFMVYNFSRLYTRTDWERCELRVVESTGRLLDLFDEYNVKATFFTLGWIADRVPELLQEIVHRGHEMASHGYGHELVKEIGPGPFKADLEKSLHAIDRACGVRPEGFRAPSFSVDPAMDWIFDTLTRAGIRYDSSLFPVPFHPDYAAKGIPLAPHEIRPGLLEFPMTCIPVGGVNIPCSGGGYFRLLPYAWFRYGFRYCNQHNRPAVFYLHPWELDPGQPRVGTGVSAFKRFRHYFNQKKTYSRLTHLLREFPFTTLKTVLEL